MDLTKTLRKRRVSLGVTQEQVARQMGVSRITVARLESCKTVPLVTTSQDYAHAVGASLVVVPNEMLGPVLRLIGESAEGTMEPGAND